MDDRSKLGIDSADRQNRYEWPGRLRGGLVKQLNPRERKHAALNGSDNDDNDTD